MESQRPSSALQTPAPSPSQPGRCPVTMRGFHLQGRGYIITSANNNRSSFTDCPILQMKKQTPGGLVACTRSPSLSGIPAQAVRVQGGSGYWAEDRAWGQRAAGWHMEWTGGVPRATYPSEEAGGHGGAPLEAVLTLGPKGGPGGGSSHPKPILSHSVLS